MADNDSLSIPNLMDVSLRHYGCLLFKPCLLIQASSTNFYKQRTHVQRQHQVEHAFDFSFTQQSPYFSLFVPHHLCPASNKWLINTGYCL